MPVMISVEQMVRDLLRQAMDDYLVGRKVDINQDELRELSAGDLAGCANMLQGFILAAILVEREACAAVADADRTATVSSGPYLDNDPADYACAETARTIAEKIRKRSVTS